MRVISEHASDYGHYPGSQWPNYAHQHAQSTEPAGTGHHDRLETSTGHGILLTRKHCENRTFVRSGKQHGWDCVAHRPANNHARCPRDHDLRRLPRPGVQRMSCERGKTQNVVDMQCRDTGKKTAHDRADRGRQERDNERAHFAAPLGRIN